MKLLKRVIAALVVGLIILAMVVAPVLAAYTISLQLIENNTSSYTMFPAIASADIDFMATENYITSTGLDTRVGLGTDYLPHMLSDDKILFATPIDQGATYNYEFTTDNAALASFDIITGLGGYITTADAVALELGNDFEIEWDGYIDTASGSDKNLVYKAGAFQTYISGNTDITSTITSSGGVQQSYTTNDDNADGVWSVNWRAQTFTTVGAYAIGQVELKLYRTGSPGDLIISIRATAAGLPTGADLTSVTIDGNSLNSSSPGQWYVIDLPAYDLAATTKYAIVIRAPDANGATQVHWRMDATGPTYAGGALCSSGDSGSSWAENAGIDFMFKTYSVTETSVVITGITSGEHTVTVTADTVDFYISVDGSIPAGAETIALAGASVLGNDSDYVWAQNNTLPYMDYITLDVSSVEIVRYEPVAFIVGTALPDETGAAQDGVITWGANPGNISTSLGILMPATVDQAGLVLDSPALVGDITDPTNMFPSDASMGTPGTVFDDIISDIAALSNTPVQLAWWLVYGFTLIVGVALAYIFTHHIGATGATGIGVTGVFIAMGIIPFWLLIFAVITATAAITAERTPSV